MIILIYFFSAPNPDDGLKLAIGTDFNNTLNGSVSVEHEPVSSDTSLNKTSCGQQFVLQQTLRGGGNGCNSGVLDYCTLSGSSFEDLPSDISQSLIPIENNFNYSVEQNILNIRNSEEVIAKSQFFS